GIRNLVSRLKKVVLPAPLGPISAWICPRRTWRSTLLTATKPLNSFVSWRVSMMKLSAVLCGAAAIAVSPDTFFLGSIMRRSHRSLRPKMWFRAAVYREWRHQVERPAAARSHRLQCPQDRGIAAADTLSSRPNRAARRQGLTDLTAVAAVTAMRNGDLKAEDYARALLERAQHLESLNAFRTLDKEMLLEAARAADKVRASGDAIGALHGLPIPVKDSVNSKALPTSNGTRALRDFRPKEDAGVLKSLLAQGGILMGKTNIHELSYGWTSNNEVFGPVHNPYDPTRVPGGSSGGSGAAVAARMAPLAVAEDTLGSIRVPATMCGLAGLRPSFGRYPGDGIMPLTDPKFDQAGPLARCVGDLGLFDAAVTGDRAPLA